MNRCTPVPHLVVPALCLLLASACAPPRLADLKPGEKPDPATPEAGLWLQMEEAEDTLSNAGATVDDPELNEYLHGLTCRLAPQYCENIRVYVMDVPDFNASMAPNGAMIIWSGLLLRVEDEAQLASVVGHEIGHYIRRHTLARWIATRDTLDFSAFLGLGAALGGVGTAGDVVQLMAIGHIQAYSRDQEREADNYGLKLISEADYAPAAAAEVWQNLIEEREAADKDEPLLFFASHPPSNERMERLRTQASQIKAGGDVRNRERLHEHLAPYREQWLRKEIGLRRHSRSLVLLDRLADRGETVEPALSFLRGELFRLRRNDGDLKRARAHLARACGYADVNVTAHRSLGLVLLQLDDVVGARDAFERYLDVAPAAGDRAMIESYLEKLP